MNRRLLVFLVIVTAVIGILVGLVFHLDKKLEDLKERNIQVSDSLQVVLEDLSSQVEELEETKRQVDGLLRPLILPDNFRFCEEIFPQTRENMERLQREYFSIKEDRERGYLWLHRSTRFFPLMERIIREKGGHEDLKYVCVIESDLSERAVSPASARGQWQFIPSTGARYGLTINSFVDERKDVEEATYAALDYFQDLHELFGTWSLALASYNGKDVAGKLRQQGVDSFFDIYFPKNETARYYFRAVIAKLILENPEYYGFFLREEDYLKPYEVDTVMVKSRNPILLREVARSCSTTYRVLRVLNPELEGDFIPPGKYNLKIPAGSRELFLKRFHRGQIAMSPS